MKTGTLLKLRDAQQETCGGKAAACAALSRLAGTWKAPDGVAFPFGNMEAAIRVPVPPFLSLLSCLASFLFLPGFCLVVSSLLHPPCLALLSLVVQHTIVLLLFALLLLLFVSSRHAPFHLSSCLSTKARPWTRLAALQGVGSTKPFSPSCLSSKVCADQTLSRRLRQEHKGRPLAV